MSPCRPRPSFLLPPSSKKSPKIYQIQNQKKCQNRCQIECPNRCQEECQNRSQEECQTNCQTKIKIECFSVCQKDCLNTVYAINTSRFQVRNYVRTACKGGGHSKKVIQCWDPMQQNILLPPELPTEGSQCRKSSAAMVDLPLPEAPT